MKVAHIITGLEDGGAEAVLYRLCVADNKNSHVVISLQGDGKYGSLLNAAGVIVHYLEMPRGSITFGGILKLVRLLRDIHPDVVQTWMYHADLIVGLVARAVGVRARATALASLPVAHSHGLKPMIDARCQTLY